MKCEQCHTDVPHLQAVQTELAPVLVVRRLCDECADATKSQLARRTRTIAALKRFGEKQRGMG